MAMSSGFKKVLTVAARGLACWVLVRMTVGVLERGMEGGLFTCFSTIHWLPGAGVQ